MKGITGSAALLFGAAVLFPCGAVAQVATNQNDDQIQGVQPKATAGVPPAASTPATTEDIIVTATKRASPLESVPVAVSVVGGETIKELNITNLQELSRQTPSLGVQEGGEQTGVSIRGFSAGLNFGFDPSVGLFIDGVYAGRERQFQSAFLDVGRVEVLRGPQATLFGKNTSAGAVLITTGQPIDKFEWQNRAEYTPRSDYLNYESVLNVPLADNLAVRFAGRVSHEDGFFYNTYTRRREEQIRNFIIRGTAKWEPTSSTTVRLKGEYSSYTRFGRNFQVSQVSGLLTGRPRVTTTILTETQNPTVPFAQGEAPRPINPALNDVGAAARLSTYLFYDPRFEYGKNYQTSKQLETAKVYSRNAVLEINQQVGSATITSVTGYSGYSSNDQRDVDWNPSSFLFQPIHQTYKQYSEELRLTSRSGGTFEYLLGAYGLYSDFFVDRQTDVDINLFFVPIIDDPNRKYATLARFFQKDTTLSLFGNATLNFDRFHITAGGRYSYEKKKIRDFLDYARFGTRTPLVPGNPADDALLATARALAPALVGQRHANEAERSETNFTPEVRLSYDLPGGSLLYASYSTGVRSGGFNSGSISPTEADLEFGPEKTTGYEIGTKFALFNKMVRANIALFREDFRRLQTSVYTGESFDLKNAGRARSQGIETDVNIRPTRGLTLTGSFLILRSKFIENTGVACNITQQYFGQPGCSRFGNGFVQDLSGKRFGPRFNGQAGIGYVVPLGADLELNSRADLTYRGTSRGGNDPDVDQPGTATLDLGTTLQARDGKWFVGALLQNVTNVHTWVFEFEAPSQVGSRIGLIRPPRRLTFRIGSTF